MSRAGEGEQPQAPWLTPACLLGEHKVRADPPGAGGSSGGLWRAEQWGLHPGPDRLGGEGVGLAPGEPWPHHLQILPVAFPTQIKQENGRVLLPWRIASCIVFLHLYIVFFSLW